jgi:molybdopterin synthase sulfur carrier subunit
MIKVEFLGPIDKEPIEVDVDRLSDLSRILNQDEMLASWLPKCAVAINNSMVSDLDTTLKSGDIVSILPPVCGG